MRKVIMPCMVQMPSTYNPSKMLLNLKTFVKIEYNDGRLSISGVIGPKSNGNAAGGCGQILDELKTAIPAEGWTREMLDKLCEVWGLWHLNDMRPYCAHQKELGWRDIAKRKVTLYHYTLTREASNAQKAAEKAAADALCAGITFTPTSEQTRVANLSYDLTTYKELTGDVLKEYQPRKPIYSGDKGPTETQLLGWLRPTEHPDGILGKKCPVCGYEYGSDWLKEEVPQKVIDWLFALPDTPVQPVWC